MEKWKDLVNSFGGGKKSIVDIIKMIKEMDLAYFYGISLLFKVSKIIIILRILKDI